MKYVLFVHFDEPSEVLLPKYPQELRLHVGRLRDFRQGGTLLMAGVFDRPGEPLSTMGVFTTRDAVDAFVAEDPFVVKGIATGHEVHAWHELAPEPDLASPAAQRPVTYVLSFGTAYASIEEAYEKAPADIARHLARSQEFHREG